MFYFLLSLFYSKNTLKYVTDKTISFFVLLQQKTMANAPKLDWTVTKRYDELPVTSMFFAEYIWIGGSGLDIRSKTKTMTTKPRKLSDFPVWNFDGK